MMSHTERAGRYCTEAAELVTSERAKTHGDFIVQHERAAEMISAYLRAKYGFQHDLTASDVLRFLIDVKVSRAMTGTAFSDDHGRDCVGYEALWAVAVEAERT